MRSKFLVLAASLGGVAAHAVSAPGAPAAPASTVGAAVLPVAVQRLVPRDNDVDTSAAAPTTIATANTTGTGVAKPVEPDPAQSPFPVSETLLLLAGLLTVGYIVRRRN